MGKRAKGVGTQQGCPYVLLGVEPACTPSQLRKAYHRLALKVHLGLGRNLLFQK